MVGISGNSVAVEFKGSQVKDITEKELADTPFSASYSLGNDSLKGAAQSLAEGLHNFHGKQGFLIADADVGRDLVGNLEFLRRQIQSPDHSSDADTTLIINALNASIDALTKRVVQLSKGESPALTPVPQVLTLPKPSDSNETKPDDNQRLSLASQINESSTDQPEKDKNKEEKDPNEIVVKQDGASTSGKKDEHFVDDSSKLSEDADQGMFSDEEIEKKRQFAMKQGISSEKFEAILNAAKGYAPHA